MRLAEHIRVADGRYWSLTCPIEGCCPAEGRPLSTDNAIAAEFVARGLAKAASREDLDAMFTPVPDTERLTPLIQAAEQSILEHTLAGQRHQPRGLGQASPVRRHPPNRPAVERHRDRPLRRSPDQLRRPRRDLAGHRRRPHRRAGPVPAPGPDPARDTPRPRAVPVRMEVLARRQRHPRLDGRRPGTARRRRLLRRHPSADRPHPGHRPSAHAAPALGRLKHPSTVGAWRRPCPSNGSGRQHLIEIIPDVRMPRQLRYERRRAEILAAGTAGRHRLVAGQGGHCAKDQHRS